MKKVKKIILFLFILCLFVGNISSCLPGPQEKSIKLLYSPNSCWKADEIDMIFYFPDDYSKSHYGFDCGLGYYEVTFDDGVYEKRYYNGQLVLDGVEYHLRVDLNNELYDGIYILVKYENCFMGYVDFNIKKIQNNDHFILEFLTAGSTGLSFPKIINCHRVVE